MIKFICYLGCLLMIVSCGGRKIVTTKPVELTIPADLAKAYEVKDLPPAPAKAATTAEQAGSLKKIPLSKSKKNKANAKLVSKPTIDSKSKEAKQFQTPNRRPSFDPIWVGEKVWMDVTWLNTKAGEFLLEVHPFKEMEGRKVYHIKGSARTSDLFSLIYKAEDWVESYVDYEGWFPYKFVLHGDETKHIRNNLELFDHAAKKQYVHIHDNRVQTKEIQEEKGFKDLTPLSQDSLSALYYVRIHPMPNGAVIRFPMTTAGSQWETILTVLGREEVATKMGYKKAIKTKVETRFNGMMQQQGDAFIWFSDDDRKFVLRFEAKVRIGWVAGIAKQIELGTQEQAPETNAENGK